MKSVLYAITQMLIILVCVLLTPKRTDAQWSTSPTKNNVICTETNTQSYPIIVSDGTGGAIITWEDKRNGVNYDIYAQRINASGVLQWTSNGVAICDVINDQTFPKIISDGAGGVIITWEDKYSGTGDIYVQKINALGIVQWTQNGVAICSEANVQWDPNIVSDGSGGAIITWLDFRSGDNGNIYAQKINSSGVVQWTSNGVAICIGSFVKADPAIVEDGTGGAIITWDDFRNGIADNIFAQKINASGVVQWTSDGVAVCPTTFYQDYPVIVGNGLGGAIISWTDYRTTTNWGIYAQMIHSSGSILWDPEGVEICDVVNDQVTPDIISDGLGGAIITWNDKRNSNNDIYVQKIDASGNLQWTIDGVPLCNEPNSQNSPTIASVGSDGTIITWQDFRSGVAYDIYAQKINASGVVQWITDGTVISNAWHSQSSPDVVSNGKGGVIITWKDLRSAQAYDIYAQNIDKYGFLGQAAPNLIAVKDIANDQGGKMRLFWDPSYLDADTALTIKSYTLKLGAKTTGILGKSSEALGSGIYWQTVDIIRADQSEGYSSVVSTYADSGLQGIPMYYFQVIAKNNDSTQSWYSNIDSGYSVDNIPPVGVSGGAIMSSINGGIKLQWNKNIVDKDLMGYVIYRDTVSGSALNDTTLLAQTIQNTFVDTVTTYGKTYYYQIAAIDMHGNIGAPSTELHQTVLSVRTTKGVAPKVFELSQNYPNPFNPSTTIEFTVPVTGQVTLKVYNAIGQEVATLFNDVAEVGRYHQVHFDASKLSSGIYFCCLQFENKQMMKKMLLMK